MKTIIGLILIASLAVTKADEVEDKADLIRHVVGYADTLKELLEENWTVETKDNEITLTSKFEVFYVTTPMSIGGGDPNRFIIPVFSDKYTAQCTPKGIRSRKVRHSFTLRKIHGSGRI
jgi:hypothetical protein